MESTTAAVRPAGTFLPLGSITPAGWIRRQLEQDLAGYAGQLGRICVECTSDVFGSGRVDGGDKRHWWNGESEGKWLDGFVRLAHGLGDPEALATAAAALDRLAASADGDGYLGIYTEDWRRAGGARPGDLWTQTFVLLALLGDHEATGAADRLAAAARLAGQIVREHGGRMTTAMFEGATDDAMVLAHNLMIVEPLLQVHALTGDDALLEFAVSAYEAFSAARLGWPEADAQLGRLLTPALPLIGHGAHTCAQLRVPLLLFHATGDPRYLAAFDGGMAKLRQCLGVSGACKSDESIGSPDNPGAPLPTAGYEYCAITELALTLQLAVALTGDMAYADMAEWLVLNAAQAARQPDGGGVAYECADNQTEALAPRWDFSPTQDDVAVCCAPSAVRLMPHHLARSVLATPDGLAVLFYGPMQVSATVQGAPVRLGLDTSWPFEDSVRIEVGSAATEPWRLTLRRPRYADRVAVTGVPAGGTVEELPDRIVVTAVWPATTTLTLTAPARPRLLRAVDGTTAVALGPLLFALPIEAVPTAVRSYPDSELADLEYRPAPGVRWDRTLEVRDENLSGARVTAGAASAEPWQQPPVTVHFPALWVPSPNCETLYYVGMGAEVDLVPLGSTTLRRTTFPAVVRSDWVAQRAALDSVPHRDSTP